MLGEPYRAVFVGSGWREYDVKEAVTNAVRNPVFAPECDQVGNPLAAADCFVLATPHEGFSLSLIEAWLAGTPVVATRVGAVPEIEARFGSLVVPVNVRPTPQELAAAVRLATSKRNKARVAKAQKVAREHFTAAKMGERWAEYLLATAHAR
jgi:glycosyltransferase involved in cell wall biosynthesis